mgnify:FL=1
MRNLVHLCLENAPGSISDARDLVKVVSGDLKLTRKFDISSIGGSFDLAIRKEFSNEQLHFRPDCALRSFRTAYLFVTPGQQNIVETTRFNDIFLHYGKSSNKLVTLTPK